MNHGPVKDYVCFKLMRMFRHKCDKLQQTLREFSLVTVTEPSHNTRVAGRTVFTSTRPQPVTGLNMKDRPKDLGLVLQCKRVFKLCDCLLVESKAAALCCATITQQKTQSYDL